MNDTTPQAPASPASRWTRLIGGLAVFLICIAILYGRKPDMFALPQFWAEDGMFFEQACRFGAASLWIAYAGYLLLIPRLIALAADGIDPGSAPVIYVGACVLLTTWVAGLAYSARFPLRPRLACALAVVLVPDAFEVLLTPTNLQWVLAAGLVALLILDDPHTLAQRIHDSVAVVLVGLTGPFSTLFAPLFIARAVLRRTWWSSILAVLVMAVGIVQLVFILRYPTGVPPNETVELAFGGATIGSRLGGSLLLGKWVPSPPSMLVGYLLAAITLGGAAWLAARPGPARTQRLGLAVAFGALLVASLYRCRFVLPELRHVGYGARYFFPLQLMLLWLALTLLTEKGWRLRVTAAALVVVMLAVNIPRLREGALADMKWADYVDRIRAGEAVDIPINPGGWGIQLPKRP